MQMVQVSEEKSRVPSPPSANCKCRGRDGIVARSPTHTHKEEAGNWMGDEEFRDKKREEREVERVTDSF